MISVKNLDKRYGDIHAVNDVSFDVEAGEIVGLLGHNGAGKTTVMKIMTGFIEPTSGTITVGGKDVRTDRMAVQRQIGYLPESAPLYPEMLVQEYLIMMAELRAIPEKDRRGAISDAVRATGLEKRLVQPIGTLSKGFRQRVGLAQAILHRPPLLVLDEPTNGLDPNQIVEIRELIRNLAKTSTIILSTHILSEVEAVCSRAVILIDGKLSANGRLDELLKSNVVRLRVADGAKDVVGRLRGIAGVKSVKEGERKGGNTLYRVMCDDGAQPVPQIIATAVENGWTIAAVAPETPSLEQVFRDLMSAQVEQARSGELAKKGVAA